MVTFQTNSIKMDVLSSPWKVIVNRLFEDAFALLGFGAKTAVGYGALKAQSQAEVQRTIQAAAKAATKCQWVEDALKRLKTPQELDPLMGRRLAAEWMEIPDPALKEAALQDIKARWGDEERNAPRGGARKKARAIYEGTA